MVEPSFDLSPFCIRCHGSSTGVCSAFCSSRVPNIRQPWFPPTYWGFWWVLHHLHHSQQLLSGIWLPSAKRSWSLIGSRRLWHERILVPWTWAAFSVPSVAWICCDFPSLSHCLIYHLRGILLETNMCCKYCPLWPQRFWLADLMGPLVLDRLGLDLCGNSGLGGDSDVSQQNDWLWETLVGARLTPPSPHESLADGSSMFITSTLFGAWFRVSERLGIPSLRPQRWFWWRSLSSPVSRLNS